MRTPLGAGLSSTMLGIALALSVATVLLFGVFPSLAASRANPAEDLKKDITRVEKAFEDGDTEDLKTITHQLKGSAGSYGFPTITQQADAGLSPSNGCPPELSSCSTISAAWAGKCAVGHIKTISATKP